MKIGLSVEFACQCVSDFCEAFPFLKQTLLLLVWCSLFASLFLLSGCSTEGAIEVKKSKESIERLVYDRGIRLGGQVAEHPSVEANTHWEFEFVPELGIERIKLEESRNGFTSIVRVKRVKIDLRLPIQVWLPESASERVIAHENGHVAICRHFYEQAESRAYKASQAILECEFSGRGETESESMQKALESASLALVTPFQNAVVLPCNRASAMYDKLTRHGQGGLPVESAVKEAIAAAN